MNYSGHNVGNGVTLTRPLRNLWDVERGFVSFFFGYLVGFLLLLFGGSNVIFFPFFRLVEISDIFFVPFILRCWRAICVDDGECDAK